MAMLKSEFITWARGRSLDYDGVPAPPKNPYQCADEIKFFLDKTCDIRGFSFTLPNKNPNGYVKSLWENFNCYSQLRGKAIKIPNTRSFIPALGDIIVWDSSVGEAGHVALGEANGTDTTNRFTSLDQNWNSKKYCADTSHSYDGVYGVIRMLLKGTTTDLNVRRGPGTNYKKVDEYPKGTLVQPLEYIGTWARIGKNLWVSANYLE